MKKRFIYERYDVDTHFKLLATGCALALTALTGDPSGKDEESIFFSATMPLIVEKGKDNSGLLIYNIKDLLKVKSLTAKKSHYNLFTGIDNVVKPKLWDLGLSYKGYIALLGRKRDGELRGYLLLAINRSWVMGIWPTENLTLFEKNDKTELQGVFKSEINDFTKPKLWKSVFMFNHPREKKN